MSAAAKSKHNLSNPAIKRILAEVRELSAETSGEFEAHPLEDNLFEWHFTIRGPPDSPFANGLYHGRILLDSDYPFKPPNFMLLTPNGRFEPHKKICLSISQHHPEFWQPSWSIRTALIAIIGFMPTKAEGAIGSQEYPAKERHALAVASRAWRCERCGESALEATTPPVAPFDPNQPADSHTSPTPVSPAAAAAPATPSSAPRQPTPTPTPATPTAQAAAAEAAASPSVAASASPAAPSVSRPPAAAQLAARPGQQQAPAVSDQRLLNFFVAALVVAIISLLMRKMLKTMT